MESFLNHSKKAREYFNNHKYEDAVKYLEKSLLLYPTDIVALDYLSRSIVKIGLSDYGLKKWLYFINNYLNHKGNAKNSHNDLYLFSLYNSRLYETYTPTFLENAIQDFKNKNYRGKRKPKIVLLMALWKRYEITERVLDYYYRLILNMQEVVDIKILCVGSEGIKSRKLPEKFKFSYLEVENYPLSQKWNAGVRSLTDYDFDGLVTIGSDDIINENIIMRYIKAVDRAELFLGFLDINFLINFSEVIYWPGYNIKANSSNADNRLGETIGAGRFYSKYLLRGLNFNIWDNISINKGLDRYASKKMETLGLMKISSNFSKEKLINGENVRLGQLYESIMDIDGFLVDIKSEESLTPIDKYLSESTESSLFPKMGINDLSTDFIKSLINLKV